MTRGSTPQPVAVVVAVLTFRREALLAAVLPSLLDQASALAEDGFTTASVMVVDNDPDGGARRVVAELALRDRVGYHHEPSPGLSAARNRALDEAREEDLLVFIDDDEQPGPRWLQALLDTWGTFGATAVSGPVRSQIPADTDPWLVGTDLFARRTRPTGTAMAGLATNNVLLDMGFVRDHGLRFDPRFGFTGGEDSKFGQDLLRAGGSIVWCDEAEVSEHVPPDRLARPWVRRRLVRTGESWVRVRIIDLPPAAALRTRTRYLAKGVAKTGLGLLASAWCRLVRSPRGRGRAAAAWAGGIGMIRGALGMNWEEYGRR